MVFFKIDTESNCKIINWKNVYKKSLKLQNRILKNLKKNNIRNVRNLQRLILKNFSVQLIVSQKLLELENNKNFKLYKQKCKNIYLNILGLNKYLQLEKDLVVSLEESSPNHRILVYSKFLILLWLVALLPINETISDTFSYNYRLYRDQKELLNEFYSVFE